ncbi:glycosyltransferase [Alkalihalobacterium chitinilyticum]|uniref:Glycosyltransferase n=1 Tax=Alkalihalobacterium chitinilyticum TaxID=2980103 RepID=A0ABT5VEW2_9BACI|nr:glycosyltransferase [Alkalihalobacterium chitinilyticum]MDE5413805.1 glycosyltransferase [Alkalihalobacterium chitinilyticum]
MIVQPKVSIIMGVYNAAVTLSESIDSLLNQTYTNWELIMCDDGSSDESYQIAKQYEKKYWNVKVIKNGQNQGLASSLNRCLEYCTGDYIARQDADDRSLPTRIEKEVEMLNQNSQYDIVSTGMRFFDEKGTWGEICPVEEPLAADFIIQSPFCHAPSMVRHKALLAVNGYDVTKKTLRVEDYNLWFRMYANGSRGCNIIEPLYEVRDDRHAIHRRKYSLRVKEAYVRFTGYRMLNLPKSSYIYALRPLIVGLLPVSVYKFLRKLRYMRRQKIVTK